MFHNHSNSSAEPENLCSGGNISQSKCIRFAKRINTTTNYRSVLLGMEQEYGKKESVRGKISRYIVVKRWESGCISSAT